MIRRKIAAAAGVVAIIGGMLDKPARATLIEFDGGWIGRLGRVEVSARSRRACLAKLRRAAGDDATLTVEVTRPSSASRRLRR